LTKRGEELLVLDLAGEEGQVSALACLAAAPQRCTLQVGNGDREILGAPRIRAPVQTARRARPIRKLVADLIRGRSSSRKEIKESMSMKLFVGGLSWDTDTDGLRRGFESFGQLEDVAVIQDRETGRSRGFGFVTFSDVEAGRTAMTAMDGAVLDGRTLRVNEAAERAPRGPGGGGYSSSFGGGGGGGGGPKKSKRGGSRRGSREDRW
jgi:cold-inducible RNA-binding protein